MTSSEHLLEEELLGSLSENESGDEVHIDELRQHAPSVDWSLVLIGRIIALKAIHPIAVKGSLRRSWNPHGELDIEEQQDGTYLFRFVDKLDLERVLRESPWTVQGHWISLKRWAPDLDCKPEIFYILKVWIQIHGVPVELRSEEVGLRLASRAGKPIKAEVVNGVSPAFKYIRVLTWINAKKPLYTGVSLQRESNIRTPIVFKYERLDVFCYFCGLLGHSESQCRDCSEWIETHSITHRCSERSHCPERDCRRFGPDQKATRIVSTSPRRVISSNHNLQHPVAERGDTNREYTASPSTLQLPPAASWGAAHGRETTPAWNSDRSTVHHQPLDPVVVGQRPSTSNWAYQIGPPPQFIQELAELFKKWAGPAPPHTEAQVDSRLIQVGLPLIQDFESPSQTASPSPTASPIESTGTGNSSPVSSNEEGYSAITVRPSLNITAEVDPGAVLDRPRRWKREARFAPYHIHSSHSGRRQPERGSHSGSRQ